MSDTKSYQRLIAVQALYEVSINKKGAENSVDELFSHILKNSKIIKKINISKLKLSREIYNGVNSNLVSIDLILKKSLSNNKNIKSFDKLLLSILRSAIYELTFKNEISKKIIISEYLLISNQFFGNKEVILLNGVLDNLREI